MAQGGLTAHPAKHRNPPLEITGPDIKNIRNEQREVRSWKEKAGNSYNVMYKINNV